MYYDASPVGVYRLALPVEDGTFIHASSLLNGVRVDRLSDAYFRQDVPERREGQSASGQESGCKLKPHGRHIAFTGGQEMPQRCGA